MDPSVGESMQLIAEEAERQGFQVRQTRGATWHFRKDNHNWYFEPSNALSVVNALSVLIDAGLDWSYKD